jgi:O-acetyl-ADP-ribose deacetylase (regulator of RNase III)
MPDPKGYRLIARYVIHTVGPVARRRASPPCSKLLQPLPDLGRAAWAEEHRFPAIDRRLRLSQRATAKIAVRTVRQAWLDRVIFCCFDTATADLYRDIIGRSASPT